MKILKLICCGIVLGALSLTMTGCNTVEGMGDDLKGTSHRVQEETGLNR